MKNQASHKKLLMPTSEIIEKKINLLKQIESYPLPQNDGDDFEIPAELIQLEEENYNLSEKYDFYNRDFEENGLIGLKDITGKILVPAKYKKIVEHYAYDYFRNEPVSAQNEEGKYGLVKTDGTGDPIIPFEYDSLQMMVSTSFFIATKNGKKGFISPKGEIITPCEWDVAYEPWNDIIVIEDGDKSGLVTQWGLYVKPIYDEIENKDEFVYVRLGNKWGYLDEEGNFIDEDDQKKLDETAILNFNPNF